MLFCFRQTDFRRFRMGSVRRYRTVHLRQCGKRIGPRHIMFHHFLQRCNLSGMHIGRTPRNAAQARCLERTLENRRVFGHETQFTALLRIGIAIRPGAGEQILFQKQNRKCPAVIRLLGIAEPHPGIVEELIGKQRPTVAVVAARLAREQLESFNLVCR